LLLALADAEAVALSQLSAGTGGLHMQSGLPSRVAAIRLFGRGPRFPRVAGRSVSRARFASRQKSRCPYRRPEAALLHPPGDGGVR
jgi:hypothetical protein